jgi:hypothetical protein
MALADANLEYVYMAKLASRVSTLLDIQRQYCRKKTALP